MVSDYVMTQNNICTPMIKPDSIAVADWWFDEHMTGKYGIYNASSGTKSGCVRAFVRVDQLQHCYTAKNSAMSLVSGQPEISLCVAGKCGTLRVVVHGGGTW